MTNKLPDCNHPTEKIMWNTLGNIECVQCREKWVKAAKLAEKGKRIARDIVKYCEWLVDTRSMQIEAYTVGRIERYVCQKYLTLKGGRKK